MQCWHPARGSAQQRREQPVSGTTLKAFQQVSKSFAPPHFFLTNGGRKMETVEMEHPRHQKKELEVE